MKRITSIILAVLLILSIAPISALSGIDYGNLFGVKAQAAYSVGDTIKFGNYPQSRVTDSSLISGLNSQFGNWKSYGYYIEGQKSSFMQYKDVSYNGSKYRAVKFSKYRPDWTDDESSKDTTSQDDNGYYTNTVYWFKYEPIKWKVLNPDTGLIIAEKCLDSQAFANFCDEVLFEGYGDTAHSYYANNYAKSFIRKWLNKDFYNTAFTDSQKENIKTSVVTNTAREIADYDSETTSDKIFLLSAAEVQRKVYGLTSDAKRKASATAYAKCQGAESYEGYSSWWMRSAGNLGYLSCAVDYDGFVGWGTRVYSTQTAVRPACKLENLKSDTDIFLCYHSTSKGVVTKAPTCTETGTKVYKCTVCGEKIKTKTLKALGHTEEIIPAVKATAAKTGLTEGKKCSVCGTILVAQTKTLAKVPDLKVSKAGSTHFILKWTAVAGAKYYRIEWSKDGGKTWNNNLDLATENTAKIGPFKPGTKYSFRVTALNSSKKIAGKVSTSVATATLCKAPAISLTSSKSKAATVTITKVTGAKSYTIYKSTDNKNWTEVSTTAKTVVTLSKLTAGKKIYVKAVANNVYGKASAYSSVKSVTVKK